MLGGISLLVALLLNTVLINAALAMAGNYYAMPPWLAALAALAFEAFVALVVCLAVCAADIKKLAGHRVRQ